MQMSPLEWPPGVVVDDLVDFLEDYLVGCGRVTGQIDTTEYDACVVGEDSEERKQGREVTEVTHWYWHRGPSQRSQIHRSQRPA